MKVPEKKNRDVRRPICAYIICLKHKSTYKYIYINHNIIHDNNDDIKNNKNSNGFILKLYPHAFSQITIIIMIVVLIMIIIIMIIIMMIIMIIINLVIMG